MTTTRTIRPATSLALLLGWAALGLGQDPAARPRDEALDDLLRQVDKAAKKDDKKPADAPKAKDMGKKPAGKVESKDEDLDDLLKSMGQTKDRPAADGKRPEPPPPGGDGQKKPPDGGKGQADDKADARPKAGDLTGDDKELDDILSGRRKKQRQKQQGQGQGQGGQDGEDGPMGDLIKQMRDVEKRLGKPDTGEDTRQKQGEIVKRLDTLIEQFRTVQTQQQMLRSIRQGKQPGQPGQADPTGAIAQGPPPTMPRDPRGKPVDSIDKSPWGHLPPELRVEMDNAFNEGLLPGYEDLIKRYYLSVSKKSLSRGE